MKNNYGKTGCIVALILTTFCSIVFSSCGDGGEQVPTPSTPTETPIQYKSVNIPTLLESPEQYRGEEIKVQGLVTSIRPKDGKLEEGKSLLVLLQYINSVLICEFLTNEYQELLEVGATYTILGTVDILAGITVLRDCHLVE